MGFFFSGRSLSVDRIFLRSARYWGTSYVCNKLFGEEEAARRAAKRAEREAKAQVEEFGYQIGLALGEGRISVEEAEDRLGFALSARQKAAARAARVRSAGGWSGQELWNGTNSNRPAALSRTGGLRGGVRQWR